MSRRQGQGTEGGKEGEEATEEEGGSRPFLQGDILQTQFLKSSKGCSGPSSPPSLPPSLAGQVDKGREEVLAVEGEGGREGEREGEGGREREREGGLLLLLLETMENAVFAVAL